MTAMAVAAASLLAMVGSSGVAWAAGLGGHPAGFAGTVAVEMGGDAIRQAQERPAHTPAPGTTPPPPASLRAEDPDPALPADAAGAPSRRPSTSSEAPAAIVAAPETPP